jgi:hypothetical protein
MGIFQYITYDIQSGRAKQDYISVVTHYVNEIWELHKRIIWVKLILLLKQL